MPPRGGEADLSDAQIRGAIVAMFNAGLPPTPVPPAAAAPEPFHRTVGGADVYLGVIAADALRSAQAEGRDVGTMREGIPSGKGWYHINISLADIADKAPITDADVSVRVADPMRADTRKLHLMAANRTVSYGGFFRMDAGKAYTVTAIIQRGGRVVDALLEHEVAAEPELADQARSDHRVLRARQAPRVEQAGARAIELVGVEALAQRACDLVVQRRLDPGLVLRREDRVHPQARVRVQVAPAGIAADRVAQEIG